MNKFKKIENQRIFEVGSRYIQFENFRLTTDKNIEVLYYNPLNYDFETVKLDKILYTFVGDMDKEGSNMIISLSYDELSFKVTVPLNSSIRRKELEPYA